MLYNEDPERRRPNQTKIVATVGPACAAREGLVELIRAGAAVFRVNTAHGNRLEHQQSIDDIRGASAEVGMPVAILVDLAGPKIRLADLPDGQMALATDARVRFVRGENAKSTGELATSYDPLVDELQIGDRVMLADGSVALIVEEKTTDSATCKVIQPGVIRSRQGLNLPGVNLSAPALSDDDLGNALWAARNGVDFIGLSFVRSAEDVLQLKKFLEEQGAETQVIAKIEKPEALEKIDAIVGVADGVMVARGDLGVEIPISDVPVAQKRIIALCNQAHKPVIVATQMLDSMQRSRIPTRAEATDVANAILDGADACMLSGETAIGEYSRQSVDMMHRIAAAAEPLLSKRPSAAIPQLDLDGVNPVTEATAFHAARLAEVLGAKALVVATAEGRAARSLSSNRLLLPTIGVSDSDAVLRRMCLYWGVMPLSGAPGHESKQLLDYVVARGKAEGYLIAGDRIVLLGGTKIPGTHHDSIMVHEVT